MQISFDSLMANRLIDWLSKERFIDSAEDLMVLILIHNLNKLFLLQHFDHLIQHFTLMADSS